jgi:hypothetical protein
MRPTKHWLLASLLASLPLTAWGSTPPMTHPIEPPRCAAVLKIGERGTTAGFHLVLGMRPEDSQIKRMCLRNMAPRMAQALLHECIASGTFAFGAIMEAGLKACDGW